MSKKVYVCNECGYAFPAELTHLIESKTQVYCERCGSPFSLSGVKFKEREYQLISKPYSRSTISKSSESNYQSTIQFFNKISFLPIFIYSLVIFFMIPPAIIMEVVYGIGVNSALSRLFLGLSGMIIAIYDIKYISPRIKEKRYNEVWVHSIGLGIVGCVIFGTGVLLLIKGILLLFYVPFTENNKELKAYDFGLMLKNSLNDISSIGGISIIFLAFNSVAIGWTVIDGSGYYNSDIIQMDLASFLIFLFMAITALIIDISLKNTLKYKKKFEAADFIQYFIIGIIGTIFYAAGIFILLKGIVLFFLLFGKPSETKTKVVAEQPLPSRDIQPQLPAQPYYPPKRIEPIEKTPEERSKPIESAKDLDLSKKEKKEVIKHIKKTEELKKDLVKEPTPEKIIELKLHESLLPVKDEKDKELVKEYFTRIFNVLTKETREKIKDLNIPKKERKELLQELAFLTAEQQVKYIETIIQMYQDLPKQLIKRIHKLPNVKPEHYGKIIEQLKYMDLDEQIQFIQFLENNA